MTQTLEIVSVAPSAPVVPPLAGPIIAAVGGVDPESVLRAARVLAPASTEGVVAVSVLTPLPVAIPGESEWMIPPGFEEERFADCFSQLAQRLDAFGGAATSWTRKVVRGSPASALTDLAREQHAAMLVLGIGRHRPLDRIFGAETALRTIQRAPCPVLVVHPSFDGPFHDVVIATDFSAASMSAARAVIPMLSPAATLHVVHVWAPSNRLDVAADEAYVKSLPESFRRFIETLAVPTGVTVKTIVREGKPAERVLDYADMHHADLVTAGRHGRNFLQRLLVGSQTSALVRAAERSLLIAPEPPFAERDRLRLMLTGSTESRDPTEWESQLRGFSQRNHGRSTVVEVDDLMFSAQVVESGYVLLGAAYDPKSKRIELTLGDAAQGARRVTRTMGAVDSITIQADETGRDEGMRISHGGGHTALTFLGE
ncbi:MAG TPA: universal stress protein [Gemmatimonadaceae bacterium]|nr:universal stress protein [Gemmatimonadaceae bacterium]